MCVLMTTGAGAYSFTDFELFDLPQRNLELVDRKKPFLTKIGTGRNRPAEKTL